jgi:DNA mismatch endonuclease (patch repair protein)
MDRISPAQRSANMRKIKSKGTKPELLVRRIAHRLGYRFRLHRADLAGKPDLVFPRLRKVIFVHGCFWHQHSSETCKRAHSPRSNLDYWKKKLQRNVARDEAARAELGKVGWETLVLWECELKDVAELENRIIDFLGNRESR